MNGDRDRLVQLLLILLDNAFDHSPPGGTVTVDVRRAGHDVELVVADEGPGIPAAERERVFEPFTRLPGVRRDRAGGTGLGLAIARRIATRPPRLDPRRRRARRRCRVRRGHPVGRRRPGVVAAGLANAHLGHRTRSRTGPKVVSGLKSHVPPPEGRARPVKPWPARLLRTVSGHRSRSITMAYVIAQPCIDHSDQSCVSVCPVDCISCRPDGRPEVLHRSGRLHRLRVVRDAPARTRRSSAPTSCPAEWADFAWIDAAWYRDPDAARAVVGEFEPAA